MTALRVGTRGSRLALWQAQFVADALAAGGGPASEVITITTSGDRLAEGALQPIGGKQLFVKEIEDALLSGQIDLAVHSAKDLPAELPDGAELAAVPAREDPRDAIVLADSPGGPAERLAALESRRARNTRAPCCAGLSGDARHRQRPTRRSAAPTCSTRPLRGHPWELRNTPPQARCR